MKNVKKLPTKQLEKFSTLFTQLGLVLVLCIVYLAIEHKTEEKKLADVVMTTSKKVFIDPDQDIVFVKEITKPKPKLIATQLLLDEPLKKGEQENLETLVIDKEPIEQQVDLNPDEIIEIVEPPKIIEDVPYDFVEQRPIFKGCEGLSKLASKECFDKKMSKFIQRNFDASLAEDLGLYSGVHKIYTQFIIDKNGDVVDIKIRAPHPKLTSETLQTLEKLPKFTPGKQNNRFVKVKYTLPISFKVD